MYDLNALARKIRKDGIDKTIDFLLSDNLSNTIKEQLVDLKVFVNGYLNLSLLYSLA